MEELLRACKGWAAKPPEAMNGLKKSEMTYIGNYFLKKGNFFV